MMKLIGQSQVNNKQNEVITQPSGPKVYSCQACYIMEIVGVCGWE